MLKEKPLNQRMKTPRGRETEARDGACRRTHPLTAIVILLGAALPRLSFLFFVGDPQNAGVGWYSDAYHHWQIAYLSKTMGFSHGFLRFWDFKGMEYFWGVLHPLLLAMIFTITGSVDILVPRLLSLVAGALNVLLVFLLTRRYFNSRAAWGAAVLAAFNPVGLFNDTSGMQEPLGISLLLLGLYTWPRGPAYSGLFWALAGTVRGEYWVFGAGLLLAALIVERDSNRLLPLFMGWGFPILLYMKLLLDRTGNPIYPLWWTFLANAVGRWQADIPINAEQIQVRQILGVLALLWALFSGWVLWKRPRPYLLLLLGAGNWLFLALVIGFTAYLRSYLPRFWVDRIFLWPYMFLAILVAALLFDYLPRWVGAFKGAVLGWALLLGLLVLSQGAWVLIWDYYGPTAQNWAWEKELAAEIASVYRGGVISIPEDRPPLTYALVRFHGFTGPQLEGQMYDPFAYIVEEDHFADWPQTREKVREWLRKEEIKLLVTYKSKKTYQEMIRREPEMFKFLKEVHRGTIQIYEVQE